MTRDDIVRMAREAGGLIDEVDWYFEYENLERFATLVAAAERERVAGWIMRRGFATGHGDNIIDMLEEFSWQSDQRVLKALQTQAAGNNLVAAVEAEREACARLCEGDAELLRVGTPPQIALMEAAAAIRARGSNG